MNWLPIYIYFLILTAVLSLILTPVFRKLAERLNFRDKPAKGKLEATTVPLLGGPAVYLSFLIVILLHLAAVMLLKNGNGFLSGILPEQVTKFLPNITFVAKPLAGLLVCGTLIMLLGLYDDYKPLGPLLKIVIQIIIVLLLPFFDIKLVLFIPSDILTAVLTVIWVVGIINAFNFLDNSDGLCGLVAAVCTLLFAGTFLQQDQYFMGVLAAILAGAVIGFLPYNWPPAKIYLGDAGSTFIGYNVSVLALLGTFYTVDVPTWLPVLTPLVILGLPIFEMVTIIGLRLAAGQPIYKGDRRHFSHRLVDLGFTSSQAVVIIGVITCGIGLPALLLRYLTLGPALLVLAQVAITFIIIGLLESAGRKGR